MWGRLLFRFYEFQCETVALADLRVLLPVLVAQPVSGRQGPHALLVVLGVLGIRIDLRLSHQPEPLAFDEPDGVILVHVAALGFRILGQRSIATMLRNTEHTTGFECPE